MIMAMNIQNLIDSLNVKYYGNLNKYLIKNNMNNTIIINYLNEQEIKPSEPEKVENVSETFVQIDRTNELYKKPWAKLNIIHKIIKIKEFVNNLKIIKDNDRDIIKEELIQLVKNKTLAKKDKVEYDENKGAIISISCLDYDNGNYFYSHDK